MKANNYANQIGMNPLDKTAVNWISYFFKNYCTSKAITAGKVLPDFGGYHKKYI